MMKPEEFNRIIIPMRDELKGLARKLTGDDYSAEDLVQEVMLKLWSMRATLDRYENKRALAMTMLRNKYSGPVAPRPAGRRKGLSNRPDSRRLAQG